MGCLEVRIINLEKKICSLLKDRKALTGVYKEEDPIFRSHVSFNITQAEINKWNTPHITVEQDPTVPSYVKQITQEDITRWNSSLRSFEEQDPTVATHIKTITQQDIAKWNSALTSFEEQDPTVPSHVKSIVIGSDTTQYLGWNGSAYSPRKIQYGEIEGIPAISYPVTSVFGRTGDVIAQSGDYTTTIVQEGTNLYYTNQRVQDFGDVRYAMAVHNHNILTLTNFPTIAGQEGKFLTNNGTALSWASLSGYVTLTGVETITNKTIIDPIIGRYYGSAASGGSTTISSTSHATKGKIFLGESQLSSYDEANSRLELIVNGLAAVSASGALLVNTTSAVNGTPQVSPSMNWKGTGWATTPASSLPLEFRAFVQPDNTSASNVSGFWKLQSSQNNGTWTDRFSVTTAGFITASWFSGTLGTSGTNTVSLNNFYATSTIASGGATIGGATTTNFRVLVGLRHGDVLTANNSYANLLLANTQVTEPSTGTIPLLTNLAIKPLAVTAGNATVNNAGTVYIEGASNAVTTGGNYALWVDDGVSKLDGDVILGGAITYGSLSVAPSVAVNGIQYYNNISNTYQDYVGGVWKTRTYEENVIQNQSTAAQNARYWVGGSYNSPTGLKLYVNQISPALTATKINDTLIALNLAPTFNNNTYTGVKQFDINMNGDLGIDELRFLSGVSNAYVAVGFGCLNSKLNTIAVGGDSAIGMGYNAGTNATSTDFVAVGWNVFPNVSGGRNIGFGKTIGTGVTIGIANTLLGWTVGAGMVAGSNNVLIGHTVDMSGDYSSTIGIGSNTRITESNTIQLGGVRSFYTMHFNADTSSLTPFTMRWPSIPATVADRSTTVSVYFEAGRGTGTGVGSSFIFRVSPPATVTGMTQNAYVDALTVNASGYITIISRPTTPSGVIPNGSLYYSSALNAFQHYVAGAWKTPAYVDELVLKSWLVVADNDAAAATAGVTVGEVYLTSANKLRTRLS